MINYFRQPPPERVGEILPMKSAADIINRIPLNPETVRMIGDASEHLEQHGRYINDLELWLDKWQEYYNNYITKLLIDKSKNIKRLQEKGKSQFIIDKEYRELFFINGIKVFFENVQRTVTNNKEHREQNFREVQQQNNLLYEWAERYEKMYQQAYESEIMLCNHISILLRENKALKQELENLKSNQSS